MTAKEYLSQYRLLDARINAKLKQLEDLRERAFSVGGGQNTGTHSSTPYDRVGELAAKIVDREAEINRDIDTLVELQREISGKLALVTDDKLRLLLELRYINCMTFERIACEMNYSYKQVCRLHGRALSAVNDVLECPIGGVL